MAQQTVFGTLVKLGETGVGVARVETTPDHKAGFVYFRPRDLADYQGETWSEWASKGLTPGRALKIELDLDDSGDLSHVSSVHLIGS